MSSSAVRHPWRTVCAWLVVTVALTVLALDATSKLTADGPLAGASTGSFGKRTPLFVALEGPRRAVERERGALIARLAHERVTLLGPAMRAAGGAELLVAHLPSSQDRLIEERTARLRTLIQRSVTPPVKVRIASGPGSANAVIARARRDVARSAALATGLAIVLLLSILRAPVATALVFAVSVSATAASVGLLRLSTVIRDPDVFAYGATTALSLALGLGYALPIVHRFRERLSLGDDPARAATVAVTAARPVLSRAAAVQVLAAALLAALSPHGALGSTAIGMVAACVSGLAAALAALPALLRLCGGRIEWLRFGARASVPDARPAPRRTDHRPRRSLLAAAALAVMAGLALAAAGLPIGEPGPLDAPAGTAQHDDLAAIERSFGGDFRGASQVFVEVGRGSLTDPGRLDALAEWERALAQRPQVRSVLGPGVAVARATAELDAGRALRDIKPQLTRSRSAQRRIGDGLERAGTGARELSSGLSDASRAARAVAEDGGQTNVAAAQLQRGVERARAGAAELDRGVAQTRVAAAALARSSNAAAMQSQSLAARVKDATAGSRAHAAKATGLSGDMRAARYDLTSLTGTVAELDDQLGRATAALTGSTDPRLRSAYTSLLQAQAVIGGVDPSTGQRIAAGYDGLADALASAAGPADAGVDGAERLRKGVRKLDSGAGQARNAAAALADGTARLSDGARTMQTGLAQIAGGAGELNAGLARLADAGRRLVSGTQSLAGGGAALDQGLTAGESQSGALTSALDRMARGVQRSLADTGVLERELGPHGRLSGVLGSGYLPLALIATGPARERDKIGAMLNLDSGADAALITVFTARPALLPGAAAKLARAVDGHATVSAPALPSGQAQMSGSGRATIVLLGLLALVALIALLRSLREALAVTVAAALTAAASLGLLRIVTGSGSVGAEVALAVYGIAFALSAGHALSVIAVLREHDPMREAGPGAIVARTGTAALPMLAVFAAFATASLPGLHQLGLALSMATLLDMTLVRPVLLPAAARGRRRHA